MRAPVLLTALATSMLALRVARLRELELAFLAWNLFLAWIPWALGVALGRAIDRGRAAAAIAIGLAWWLFYPNAIYLVTDLVYAGHGRGALRWYDAAMVGAFAFAGAAIAIRSLEHVRARLAARAGEPASWAFASAIWLSTGLGVWLGRVQRWNSWDVLTAPHEIARDAAQLVLAPHAHAQAWIVTLVFAGLLAALQLGARRA